jgi:sugar phosphate isomerase/epimerase
MKIGMVTDSLGHLSFDDMLDTAAAAGIEGVEFNACNWTTAPHFDLKGLAKDTAARQSLKTAVKARGARHYCAERQWQSASPDRRRPPVRRPL